MTNRLHTYITALLLSALTVTGCSGDDSVTTAAPKEEEEGNTLVLRLGLSMTAGTRATGNPTGGENGDGWRLGKYNENKIYDVYLYKYSSADGINASDDTPVTLLAFEKGINFRPTANDVDANGNIVMELKMNVGNYRYKAANNEHFIAAVNTEMLSTETTLGKLRNELISYTCQQKGTQMKDYDVFTMANAHDSQYEGGSGTEADPYVVGIDVERTTARLDFAYSEAAKTAGTFRIDGDKYIYKVNGTDDEVYLSHVRATNVSHGAPYLIKRLAANATDAPAYLADETNPATKYVVEPFTWAKTVEAVDAGSLNFSYLYRDSWYRTAHDTYRSTTEPWFRNADKVHCGTGDAFTNGTTLDEKDGDWNYYVLGYANENTMVASETHQNYATGLILKGTYVPKKVFKDVVSATVLTEDEAYTVGTTFWRCHEIDTDKDLFFSNEAAANAYHAIYPQSVVYAYENGQCYYNVWLRHENIIDDPTTTMMEFGIVRNNIYRVCVEFTGIGMPEIPDVMVTPENIRMFIYVRKWNLIQHPEIEI